MNTTNILLSIIAAAMLGLGGMYYATNIYESSSDKATRLISESRAAIERLNRAKVAADNCVTMNAGRHDQFIKCR